MQEVGGSIPPSSTKQGVPPSADGGTPIENVPIV